MYRMCLDWEPETEIMRVAGKLISIGLTVVLTTIVGASPSSNSSYKNWPQWRGPYCNGSSEWGSPPVEWSEDQNVAWKVAIPGQGSSSPIIWGDKVYLTTAVSKDEMEKVHPQSEQRPLSLGSQLGRQLFRKHKNPLNVFQNFVVLAIDRGTGKLLWENTVKKIKPHEGHHQTGSYAASSAVTDGENVYAFFGSRGIYCLDENGTLKWGKDLGRMSIKFNFGEGASPALYGETLILPWDHEGQSFIVALDKKTGKELWRVDRDEDTSWSTPLVVEHDGGTQVITSATHKIRSYDLVDGTLIWEVGGMTRNTIPTPVFEDGIVYLTSGFRGNSLLAIRISEAKGDITGSEAIVWNLDRDTPYVPSPLIYKKLLYLLKGNNGILSVFDARTGELHSQKRIAGLGNIYSSPVGTAGRIYVTDRQGKTAVLKAGSDPEVLYINSLEDEFNASMAIVGDEIYLRGKYLYRISIK